MSEQHRSYFNDKAATWDQLMEHRSLDNIELMIKSLAIRPGSVVLDAGTGTGVLLPLIKESVGGSGLIIALDLADEMLLQAQKKNGNDGIQYVCGDLAATHFEESYFDEIICYSSFPHIIDKAATAKEMRRIIKPGGRVVICHTSQREELNRMHQSIGGVVGHDLLPDNDTMGSIFCEGGFTDIVINDQANQYILTARRPK